MNSGVYQLPGSAMYGSPVYVHSHAYTFYNQLSLLSGRQSAAIAQLHAVQNGVTQVLRDNIAILERVHEAYDQAGFNLDLLDLSESFKELKEIKAQSLLQNTLSHKIAKYRRMVEERIISLIEKWLNGSNEDFIVQEVEAIVLEYIGEDFSDGLIEVVNGKINTKKMRQYLKSLKTRLSGKGAKHIAHLIVKKIIKRASLEKLGLISELDLLEVAKRKQAIEQRFADMTNFFKDGDPVWTTTNLPDKIDWINKFYKDNVYDKESNIFKPGMPKAVAITIGHLFEAEIVRFFYERKNWPLSNFTTADGDTIRADIVPQAIQNHITTDVDLNIVLDAFPQYSYGISAKTSIGGMNFKTSDRAFNGSVPEETWRLIFYILINYYALRNYEANNKALSANFQGSSLIDSVMQAIFIVQAAGDLLGNCFIETKKGEGKTLSELVEKHGNISLPILLMFPNKTIYTVDLLRAIFEEFSKQAEGVFNAKFKIDAAQLQHNWVIKQAIIKVLKSDPDSPEGKFYDTLYDQSQAGWLVEPINPFEGNWFTFNYNYNKDWLQ